MSKNITMTHNYTITGMTCSGCQAKVEKLLGQVHGVKKIGIDLAKGEAEIEMERHIPTEVLRSALKDYPKYALAEVPTGTEEETVRSWWVTYKPILLIFGYITLISLIAGRGQLSMRVFMSGFFLTFSFFKMLDLKGFAESYSMYDIVARRFRQWGYIYGFIELALGISFALNFQPFLTNLVTLIVMTVSIIGVLQSVFNKRKIRCACLGAVFNLPMSTVTIVEDAVMILMSGVLLIQMV